MAFLDGIWLPEESVKSFRVGDGKQGWASQGGFRYQRAGTVATELPTGVYSLVKNDQGLFFEKQAFPSDNVISLPGLPTDYILGQMRLFWSRAKTYQDHGLIHKRGILLYGAPGCGKTSVVRLLCNEIIKKQGIVFIIDDFIDASKFVNEFRSAEPHRMILTIQEDIEGYFNGNAGPEQLKAALAFLDGEDQTHNVVHLATTNEPETLADRFIKRPGRFDLVIGIHAPTEEARRTYLKHVDPRLSSHILEEIVSKTEGLSLAYLRELISTYVCLDIPLEETINRLKVDSKRKVLKNRENTKMGFTVGYSGE